MNPQSQHSLLKFIEEPEEGIYGILCTTNISKILPTIISRCQIFNFKALDDRYLDSLLEEKGLDSKMASILSKLTNNYDDAMALSSDVNMLKIAELFDDFLRINKASEAIVYQMKNLSFFDNYDNLLKFLNILVVLYEDIIAL